jgi:hypothetical protein
MGQRFRKEDQKKGCRDDEEEGSEEEGSKEKGSKEKEVGLAARPRMAKRPAWRRKQSLYRSANIT